MADARQVLGQHYHEFKICGALYNLADRFKALFDGIKGVVDLGRAGEIEYLVRDLASGERNILDHLGDLTRWMGSQGSALSDAVDTKKWPSARATLLEELEVKVMSLEQKRDDFVREARHLLSRM